MVINGLAHDLAVLHYKRIRAEAALAPASLGFSMLGFSATLSP
jgi:hypothetical protein